MTAPPCSPQAIEHVDTDSLIPHARNARVHDPEQIARLAKSMGEYGFTNPVLIDGNRCGKAGQPDLPPQLPSVEPS
jgi:ParB-like chromosome segregation protein Spo0J